MTHLEALQLNLSNERSRLVTAKSAGEVALRTVWVAQLEREIAAEAQFVPDMTDDDLLAALTA